MSFMEKIFGGQTDSKAVNKELEGIKDAKKEASNPETPIQDAWKGFVDEARANLAETIKVQAGRDPKFAALENDPAAFEAEVIKKAKVLAENAELAAKGQTKTGWFNSPN